MKTAILEQVLANREAKRQFALVTHLESGKQTIAYPDSAEGDIEIDEPLRAAVDTAIRDDKSATIETEAGMTFVQVFNPPLRMLIVGAVHIAQPLARMAAVSGYDISVIDPRGSFATDDRFPGVTLINEWPDEALPPLDADRRTAVVTLTHDPKIDDPALAAVLRSEAFYIGALGSRRTHAARVERLTEAGFNETEISRIHGPVGLSLGAVSPAELAVSILGQVTQVLHAKEITAT